MQLKSARSRISREAVDEASAWFVEFRLGDADAEARRAFDAWLRSSPAHVRAYIEVAATYAGLPAAETNLKFDTAQLIAAARADSTVVPFSSAMSPPGAGDATPAAPSKSSRPARARWALAAAILLLIGAAWLWQLTTAETIRTVTGEQRSLTLDDGSRVELNARSSIRIRFSDAERRVDLLEGQALFHVAPEPGRAFIVDAGDIDVRAVGTQFDVNRGRTGTIVTVIEGRVAVLTEGAAGEREIGPEKPSTANGATGKRADPLILDAGQRVRVTGAEPLRPAPANVDATTAWTRHQLAFDGTPLIEVIEQFNRQNKRQLRIASVELNALSISGVYTSPDPQSLVNFLRTEPDILIVETPDEVIISRKPGVP